jgi:hypothetical protein
MTESSEIRHPPCFVVSSIRAASTASSRREKSNSVIGPFRSVRGCFDDTRKIVLCEDGFSKSVGSWLLFYVCCWLPRGSREGIRLYLSSIAVVARGFVERVCCLWWWFVVGLAFFLRNICTRLYVRDSKRGCVTTCVLTSIAQQRCSPFEQANSHALTEGCIVVWNTSF